ncbi:MAG: hypothetical protein ACLRFE_02085 [Clostridia bacterium]
MKKFTTIFMTCLIMLVVVLTGCSTFRIDKVKYYNEVLAKVGDETITRLDLVNAYNSYGRTNFVTQAGQSEAEAMVSTMNILVQRKLMVKYAEDNMDKFQLTKYEINNVYRETVDSLLESISSNMDTARKIYNLELDEDKEDEVEEAEKFTLSEYDYEKRVEIINGQIKFIDTNTEKDADTQELVLEEKYATNYPQYHQSAIVNGLLAKFKEELYANKDKEDVVLYQKVCDKAIELTCNNLINYEYYLRENNQKLSTKQDDLLFRYVERNYESQLENAYITKINNYYLKTETLSNESVINAFKAMYESDYAKYVNDADAYNTVIVKTDSELTYYHPTNTDAEFGYFLHVLLPLNNVESDLTWLKEHRHLYTDEQYEIEQMELINQIMCAQRTLEDVRDDETDELLHEEGVTLDEQVSIIDVLNEYKHNVKDLASFKKFMFKYTTDNATLTADMPYVIGYNTETDEEYSSMVTNFTAEAIRLMKENKSYTQADEYILTNYGVHLLYYVAPVVNTISVEDVDSLTVEKLNSMVLNYATGETYLDRVFDLVYPAGSDGMFTSNTKFSSYEQTLIDSLYAKYPVTLYETKIKASNKI